MIDAASKNVNASTKEVWAEKASWHPVGVQLSALSRPAAWGGGNDRGAGTGDVLREDLELQVD
jgi:hypothetical protein